jgi:putative ABC transport system permease protein
MVLTLLTLGTGGAVFLGALNLKASIRAAVDTLFAPQRYDLSLRLANAHATDSIESAIMKVPGVDAAESWTTARGAVSHADGTLGNAFGITAPPVPSALLSYPVVAGRWLQPGDTNALVVSRSLIKDDSLLSLGRTVSLVIGGKAGAWTVVGVVDAGPSPSAFASRSEIMSLLGENGSDVAVVRLAGADDAAGTRFETVRRIRAELADAGMPVASGQLVEENRRVMEDHLLMVADFLGAMAWLMIVVGGLGLASTMSLAVLERTREIGVLRAIGARHRSILAMIQVEGLVVGILSWAVALPLSIPMSVALGRAFGRVMLPVADKLIPEPSGVLWWLGLVMVVSLVACAWPALRAMRISTRAALSYE